MSSCSYTEKNQVCANLHQSAREAGGRRDPQETCDPGLSNGKLITSLSPDRLGDGPSLHRPVWLSPVRTRTVSLRSQQVLATDTENVRTQKACGEKVTEGWRNGLCDEQGGDHQREGTGTGGHSWVGVREEGSQTPAHPPAMRKDQTPPERGARFHLIPTVQF